MEKQEKYDLNYLRLQDSNEHVLKENLPTKKSFEKEYNLFSTNRILNTICLIKTFLPEELFSLPNFDSIEENNTKEFYGTLFYSLLSSNRTFLKSIVKEIDLKLLITYSKLFGVEKEVSLIFEVEQKPFKVSKKQEKLLLNLLLEDVFPLLSESKKDYDKRFKKLIKQDRLNNFIFNSINETKTFTQVLEKYSQCCSIRENFFESNKFDVLKIFTSNNNFIEATLLFYKKLQEFSILFQQKSDKTKLISIDNVHITFSQQLSSYLGSYYYQLDEVFKKTHHSSLLFLFDIVEMNTLHDGQFSIALGQFLSEHLKTNKQCLEDYQKHIKKWEDFSKQPLSLVKEKMLEMKEFLDFLYSNNKNLFNTKKLEDLDFSTTSYKNSQPYTYEFIQCFSKLKKLTKHGLIVNPFNEINNSNHFDFIKWCRKVIRLKNPDVKFIINDFSPIIFRKSFINAILKGFYIKKPISLELEDFKEKMFELQTTFPEFSEVVDFYLQQMNINNYKFKPVLLVGNIGREKLFVDSLLKIFQENSGLTHFIYNCETLPADYFNSLSLQPEGGNLLKIISLIDHPNFFMSFYNVDKNSHLLPSLIEVVDPKLNSNVLDVSTSIRYNAEHINHIATANDLSKLSKDFTQCFEVFQLKPMTKEQMKKYIEMEWLNLISKIDIELHKPIPDNVLEQLSKYSYIEVNSMLGNLLSLFINSNKEITLNDVLLLAKNLKTISINSGNSHFSIIEPNDIDIDLEDIKGCEEAKLQLNELVDIFQNHSENLPLSKPKGFIMYGAPGVGKTMLAKAFAKKSNMPFISLSGSSFVEKYVGIGAKRVRELFQTARQNAPCIIYIDEIDALGSRNGDNNSERETTINEFLIQMDGIKNDGDILVIGSTNFLDKLDKALIRAGRFDRKIELKLPTKKERLDIILHLNKTKFKTKLSDNDLEIIAKMSYGSSPAEIVNLFQQALIIAFREKREVVLNDFREAMEEIDLGIKTFKLNDHDKRSTAYHEIGHAVLGHLLEHANPVRQVTVVPRSTALGITYSYPDEENLHVTKEQLLDDICMTLGGRAAEELFIKTISTGASGDIRQVTKIANNMIVKYGFAEDEYLSMVLYDDLNKLSDLTKNKIEQEVLNIIKTQYQRAKEILMENEKFVHKLTELLIEREVIYEEDIIECQKSLS